MCKQDTIIDDGYARQWKLDCLHCLEFNKLIACAFTNYKKDIGEWKLCGAAIYFHMPERPHDMFIWGFNVIHQKTTLARIGDADTGIKNIYTFDKIMDINLDNLINKTKLTLMFS